MQLDWKRRRQETRARKAHCPARPVPLAITQAFAHNQTLTTAHEQVAKARTEGNRARQFVTDSYDPEL